MLKNPSPKIQSTFKDLTSQKVFLDLLKTEGVVGCLLVTADGISIQTRILKKYDGEMISAVLSAIVDSIKKNMAKMNVKTLDQILIETRELKFLIQDTNAGYYFVVLAEPGCNLGLIRFQLHRAYEKK